jgi:hypothetical protein
MPSQKKVFADHKFRQANNISEFTAMGFTFALSLYNISFVFYCLTALGNLILLIVLTILSAENDYETINRWDAIYHGHNLGAHICSIITVVNMWRPKGFIRTPSLSILHFVGIEAVKLFFAGKWITYWPNSESVNWLVYNVAGLNTTAPGGDDYENKHKVFVDFTTKYNISWQQDPDARIAPWWPDNDGTQGPFLDWVRGRTYKMVGPVIGLAAVTSAIGLLVCVLAYLEFLRLKSKPKPRHESALQSDPMVTTS